VIGVLGLMMIPGSHWLWLAGAVALVTLALLVRSYWPATSMGGSRALALGLKLLAILILGLCLAEPLWSSRRAQSGANLFAVVVDNSESLTVRDRGTSQTRGQILQGILSRGRTGWLAELAKDFQVCAYVFDGRCRRTVDFSELTFDGKTSALATTLRTLAERYRGRPLAGVLLLTDGIATDMDDSTSDGSGLAPVYPVVIGQDRVPDDLAITTVSVSQTSFEDAPVTIQADVEATGHAARTIAIDLTDDSGDPVERQTWKAGTEDAKQVFRFRFRPAKTGVLFYHLQASVAGSRPEDPCQPTSPIGSRNQKAVVVDRGGGPYRVLYVAGRPNWEYKFLQRAVSEDDEVQLVGLIRVARREPKYDWRGRAGEQSNPLYRGFNVHDQEQTEAYDQPVLVRLNTRDEAELRGGFPKTSEELFSYHAVIVDDVDASFFTYDQLELLRRYVAERGGGFLMLGGQESFVKGGYDRSPLSHMLPVYLGRPQADVVSPAVRLSLTREGWLQPWVRVRESEQAEKDQLAGMPEFHVLNRVSGGKPGASVLATAEAEPDQAVPALVVQRYGNGRSAALMVGDVWRWGFAKPQMHPDMDKFWRQTVRWLVADVPGRVALSTVAKADAPGQAVVLQVRVKDKAFQPMENVTVTLEIRDPQAGTVHLSAEPRQDQTGLYEATYVPRTSGGHAATAVVSDANGTEIARTQTGWVADLEGREFRSIKANRPLLEKIARQTGGRLIEAGDLDAFVRNLPQSNAPVSEVWVRPFWDLPWVESTIIVLVLGCLVAEWAIRRWKGMP
jgi:uncharacterized membrane protein